MFSLSALSVSILYPPGTNMAECRLVCHRFVLAHHVIVLLRNINRFVEDESFQLLFGQLVVLELNCERTLADWLIQIEREIDTVENSPV